MSQLKTCSPTILLDTDLNRTDPTAVFDTYLDLSKISSGNGTFENMYNWEDIVELLSTINGGKKLRIWTIGSNNSLFNNQNRILIENKSFSNTLGQKIEFISYRPYDFNIPIMGSGVSSQWTLPFIELNNVSGLTLTFSRFRISTTYQSFITLSNCRNTKIALTNCGITYNSNKTSDPFISFEDCYQTKLILLNNGIQDIPPQSNANYSFITETHSINSVSTDFDLGTHFDAGRHFDTTNEHNITRFYFENNYISWNNTWNTFFTTDNFKSRIRIKNNRYRTLQHQNNVELYQTVSRHNIETDAGNLIFNTTTNQFIEEFTENSDWRLSLKSSITNKIPYRDLEYYTDFMDSDLVYYDILGHYRNNEFCDCGPYEIDGIFYNTITKYVDLFPLKTYPGNDGACVLLLHLDQTAIQDKSSLNTELDFNGIQIRNGYAVLFNTNNVTAPCDIDIDKGVTIDFRIKVEPNSTKHIQIGDLVFPIYLIYESNALNLIIDNTNISLGLIPYKNHIAIQYFNSTLSVYLNGTLAYSSTFTPINYDLEQITFGYFDSNTINIGSLEIQELRISNTLRWDSTFTPPQEGVHYADFGKLGWYFEPLSQFDLEHQLNQLVSKDLHVFKVFGASSFWNLNSLLETYYVWHIESDVRIQGFQNDGRGLPVLGLFDTKILYIDPLYKLEIDKVLLLWNINFSNSDMFRASLSEDVNVTIPTITNILQASLSYLLNTIVATVTSGINEEPTGGINEDNGPGITEY